MSAFTGPLRVEHQAANYRLWKLLELLRWAIDTVDSGIFVDVPNVMYAAERLKVKLDEYLWLHKVLTGVSERTIWQAMN